MLARWCLRGGHRTLGHFAESQHKTFRANSTANPINFLTADALRGLVEKGDYDEAARVREQLAKEQLAIPAHTAYLRAVRHVLQTPSKDNYDAASQIEDWLSLYPDAQYFHQHPFRSEFSLIQSKKNKEILYTFGRVCALKGYHWIVMNKVVPALSSLQDTDDLCKELQELVQNDQGGLSHAEQLKASKAKTDTMSDMSYFSHIQQRLVKTLPEVAEEDSAPVFEDMAEDPDYNDIISETPLELQPTNVVFKHLDELIMRGQYQSARRILNEAIDLRMAIIPSQAFVTAAAYTLGAPLNGRDEVLELNNHERTKELVLWLSNIPIHRPNAPEQIKLDHLIRLLFQPVIPNMKLIQTFGIVAASRGYASAIAHRIIPFVMQFARPSEAHEFLQAFESKNQEFYHTYRAEQEHGLRKNNSYIRSMVVRQLARARRFDEAMSLIPSESDGFTLSAYTHQFLLAHLTHAGRSEADNAERMKQLHQTTDWDAAGTQMRKQVLSWMYATRMGDLQPSMMPWTLRAIVQGLRGSRRMPHPMTVMHFLDMYLIGGRSYIIPVLRRIAWRSGYRAASTFVGAELMYAYHRGYHSNVIKKFVENFYLTGVPRVDVLRVLKDMGSFERADVESDSEVYAHPVDGAQSIFDGNFSSSHKDTGTNNLGKLFPSPAQCAIVFHSLVALTPDPTRRENLYNTLLSLSEGTVSDQLPYIYPAYAGLSPLLPPKDFIAKVSSMAFVPFIRPLMRESGLQRGPEILRDMSRVGLKPSIVHWTELAGCFARSGEKDKAIYVLDRMEEQLEDPQPPQHPNPTPDELMEEEGAEMGDIDLSPLSYDPPAEIDPDIPIPLPLKPTKHNPKRITLPKPQTLDTSPNALPPPDFVMYISLMRGFLIAKDFDAVGEVHRRLKKRFKVAKGQNIHLDAVMEDWAVLLRMKFAGNTDGFYRSRRKEKSTTY